ncbi:MAG: MATE family efflux transporter [Bacilli bacterium]|nr:MATE family efflux transporter [Bacilli bacterium]
MPEQTRDLTVGKPWKQIVIFSLPLIVSFLFQNLYNIADSIIVGNFLGDESLAAVSSSGSFVFLFTSFFIGLSLGCGALIGKFFGEKNKKKLSESIHSAVAIGLVSSIVLTILAEIFSPLLLKVMGTPSDVIGESISYFRAYFIGSTGLVMYAMLNAILQAVGNSRRGLYYLVFASLLNVGLDLILVKPLGVFGAGLASSISQISSATLAFLFLIKKGTVYQVEIKKIRFYKGVTKKMIMLGIPSGIQNSVIGIANVCVQSFINSFGSAAMAGCGSYSRIEGFAFIPINAFMGAITNFVSQNLGAKEYERAKQGARFGIITSVIVAEIIGGLQYLLAPQLIGLFTSTPECIAIGVQQARTISLFYFLLSYSHCVSAVCRGGGKPVVPMLVMLIDWCVIRVIYINIAMKISHTINLLFWAYPITWTISTIFYIFYYYLSDWVHGFDSKKPILDEVEMVEE